MAFDQSTRNRLQRFVSEARAILEEEFTRQLQNDYGLDPDSGTVSSLESLRHITDQQRETTRILRATLEHYCAGSDTDTKAGLDRMVREQAFTIFNRLAALRMAEARGLLIETVGNGYQSQGFQLYARLAGTGLGETGDAYRVFLQSVFDELAQDLPGLFDRFSPQGRLFPRETALLEVIDLINHGEIEPLWTEDETIGWIYQFFNSKEERKEMKKSRAPRDSRELAVRNQFFTPRYVVEFLVDNTLGRLWFNWTGGHTSLRDRCQYLLVKPDEQPEPAKRLRDPRTIKLLDPACGSMHFGLYAFDLFLEIYQEAWDWEKENGVGTLDTETGGSAELEPLSQTYADKKAFLHNAPQLILEYNIYGVDIDPRAAQIASLALWLRAQRAWHEAGVNAKDRPKIAHGNIVAAVAPPAELELRKRFMEKLDPLDAKLFEKTLYLLKGLPELGVLLQVEKELPALIREVFGEHGELFHQYDIAQWRNAETRLREALTAFVGTTHSSYERRLFAEDALENLKMIDLCSNVFDVFLMNPPFGEAAKSTNKYLDERYPNSKGNILSEFIERSSQLTRKDGQVGAIVSRTCFFLQSFRSFRSKVLSEKFSLNCFVDLGSNVLDAMVEVAAATWTLDGRDSGQESSTFIRMLPERDKETALLHSLIRRSSGETVENIFERKVADFQIFDDQPYIYWISPELLKKISDQEPLEPAGAEIRVGLQTGDDFRFLRTWWEVSAEDIIVPDPNLPKVEIPLACIELSKSYPWAWYSKTEIASPLISSIHLLVNWRDNGSEIKAYHENNGHSASKYVMSESKYFLPGFSYMLRSVRLVPYLVPSAVIPTAGRSQVYPKVGSEYWVAAILSSNLATAVARFRGESFSGPKFQNSMVAAVPYTEYKKEIFDTTQREITSLMSSASIKFSFDEAEIKFLKPMTDGVGGKGIKYTRSSLLGKDMEIELAGHYGISGEELRVLERDLLEALRGANSADEDENGEHETPPDDMPAIEELDNKSVFSSWAVGVAFGRFDLCLATGERPVPPETEPFERLPSKSPGMLPDGAEPFHAHSGILVDDQGHPHDLARLIEEVLARVDAEAPGDVRRWLQRDFFKFHLKQYSKSRRKAPIYWPISTNSGSYTFWLYYPDLTNQTLYTALNDFVEPKLKEVRRDLATLRDKGGSRSSADEKALEKLQDLELELIELRDALLEIAPTYRPNHDDGVQITAAPLWQLFRHKPWQKVLKDTWTKLEKGDYDWARLAKAYWPDRVREKCKTDKSLAIAHDLEHLYVEPEDRA